MFAAAVIQMNCGADAEANWESARRLIRRAAGYGAQLIATPENINFLGSMQEKVHLAEGLNGQTCRRFSQLAAELKVHLLLGSFNERGRSRSHCRNSSVLFGPDGSQMAVYRKIHLFDVDLSEKVRFQESRFVQPGRGVCVAETSLGRIGLSICFDLRFPDLYQRLAGLGAQILTVPSAFTLTTGKDHWEPLLRARAIECQCYVLAPAQQGRHDDEGIRESYGHSMIVDPWGHVLARAAEGPGIAMAEIDLKRVEQIRRALPVRRETDASRKTAKSQ
jgi:predicted amidohydrolase